MWNSHRATDSSVNFTVQSLWTTDSMDCTLRGSIFSGESSDKMHNWRFKTKNAHPVVPFLHREPPSVCGTDSVLSQYYWPHQSKEFENGTQVNMSELIQKGSPLAFPLVQSIGQNEGLAMNQRYIGQILCSWFELMIHMCKKCADYQERDW